MAPKRLNLNSGTYPQLNFPPAQFKLRNEKGILSIWDNLRGMWLVLTPEEWVRQHLISYLIGHRGVLPARIRQEYPVRIGRMTQRADAVIFGDDGQPLLLAECKSPGVGADKGTYAQAVRYNRAVGARYLLITDGIRHYIWEAADNGEYSVKTEFPELK